MARPFEPQIVTANDLLEGDVVYRTESGAWSRDHGDAHLATTKEAADALLAAAEAEGDRVVGAYLAAATIGAEGRPEPVRYREAIRAKGPTFRTDLGKQANGAR